MSVIVWPLLYSEMAGGGLADGTGTGGELFLSRDSGELGTWTGASGSFRSSIGVPESAGGGLTDRTRASGELPNRGESGGWTGVAGEP